MGKVLLAVGIRPIILLLAAVLLGDRGGLVGGACRGSRRRWRGRVEVMIVIAFTARISAKIRNTRLATG